MKNINNFYKTLIIINKLTLKIIIKQDVLNEGIFVF